MMPDVKTTINALRYTLRMFESHSLITVSCNDFFTDMLKDTLDVIEDQSRTINRLNESHKTLIEQYKELNKKYFEMTMIYGTDAKVVGEIVRCKDCKHHGTMDCPMCEEGNCIFHTADNWYCADGERRTDDA